MKNHKRIILFFLVSGFLSLPFAGCKKGCKPGTGGEVTFNIVPQHHGKPVLNRASYPDSVMIKFNASDFPGVSPSNYDIVSTGITGDDFVNIPNLHCGQYFIYVAGFDTTINLRVVGGIPIDVSETSGTKTIYVPITE